jgi:hypothetical protein
MENGEWAMGPPGAALDAQPLNGHFLPAGASPGNDRSPERQLVAGILLQALTDAWAGSLEAIEWMEDCAPFFGEWLDLEPACLAGWRNFRPPTAETWDPAEFADV